MELLQLGFFSLGSRCNRPGRGGRRKRRGSGREKSDRVSPGFDRVDRFQGRPGGSTGFPRANSQAGFSLHPDRSQAGVSRVPGRPAEPVRVLKHWRERRPLVGVRGTRASGLSNKKSKSKCENTKTLPIVLLIIQNAHVKIPKYPQRY
jgi:hypothetical protein